MSENGVPRDWVKLMKASMKSAAAGFSARRMVRQYVEKFYAKRLEGVLKP
jgi:starch phosphorylase